MTDVSDGERRVFKQKEEENGAKGRPVCKSESMRRRIFVEESEARTSRSLVHGSVHDAVLDLVSVRGHLARIGILTARRIAWSRIVAPPVKESISVAYHCPLSSI